MGRRFPGGRKRPRGLNLIVDNDDDDEKCTDAETKKLKLKTVKLKIKDFSRKKTYYLIHE